VLFSLVLGTSQIPVQSNKFFKKERKGGRERRERKREGEREREKERDRERERMRLINEGAVSEV
jgi:hypothetical protein